MSKFYCLFLLCSLAFATLIPSRALAQAAPTTKATEQYCMVLATARPFSTKVSITLDYGQETKLFGDRGVVRDEQGNVQKFNFVIDALNYMSNDGWMFVNAYAITVGG